MLKSDYPGGKEVSLGELHHGGIPATGLPPGTGMTGDPLINQLVYSRPHPSTPNNLTGIYLGSENATFPRQPPPCAHPAVRGRARTVNSMTSIESRRYKMVELLREKEIKRGFSGKVLKPRKTTTDEETPRGVPVQTLKQKAGSQAVPIWEITRKTARNFTPSTNSGVTHLEYLHTSDVTYAGKETTGAGGETGEGGDQYTVTDLDAFNPGMKETVMNEVKRITENSNNMEALADCYQRICKGNINSLSCLLPNKLQGLPKKNTSAVYTGFTVKSYRNPSTAEIVTAFPCTSRRPLTIGSYHHPFRHHPGSYTYKPHHNQTSHAPGDKHGVTRHRHMPEEQKLPHAPPEISTTAYHRHAKSVVPPLGSGISRGHPNTPIYPRSLNEATVYSSGTTDEQQQQQQQTRPTADINVPAAGAPSDVTSVGRQTPSCATGTTEAPPHPGGPTASGPTAGGSGTTAGLDSIAEKTARSTTSTTHQTGDANLATTTDGGGDDGMVRTTSCADISIGVENDDGEKVPVDIDATNQNHTHNNYVPSDTQANIQTDMQALAESRKKELQDLFSEHAQIVKEVSDMQSGSTAASPREPPAQEQQPDT